LITTALMVCIFSVAGVNSLVQFEGTSTEVSSPTSASTEPSTNPLPSPSPQTVAADPIVTTIRWHTSQPAIATPQNRLDYIPPLIQIASPTNHTTIHNPNVTLTVKVASYFWIIDSVYCKTDWQPQPSKLFGIQPSYVDALNATITATFPQVPKGTHIVTIYASTHDGMHAEATLTFTKIA
jgi:hypothetical protein